MRREIKSIVIDSLGKAHLNCANNAPQKRARGKCVTAHCRNYLPASAIQNHNKHCSKCMMRIWRINSGLKATLARLRERARERAIPFSLTEQQLLEVIGDSNYLILKGRVRGMLHLDRIIPAKGYVMGNVQVLSVTENTAKGAVEKHIDPEPNLDWLDEF